MTTPDVVLAATTADVRKRCDELEARVRLLEAALRDDAALLRLVARDRRCSLDREASRRTKQIESVLQGKAVDDDEN